VYAKKINEGEKNAYIHEIMQLTEEEKESGMYGKAVVRAREVRRRGCCASNYLWCELFVDSIHVHYCVLNEILIEKLSQINDVLINGITLLCFKSRQSIHEQTSE